jgi:putative membrane protein
MSLVSRLLENTVALAAVPLFAPARGRSNADGSAQAFVAATTRAGAAEIALSEVALTHSPTPTVREFAHRMVTEHTALDEELRSLAAVRRAAPPAGPFDDIAAEAARLADLTPETFDAAYLDHMVADHEQTIALFARQAAAPGAPELAALAERSLPTLRDHLSQARTLRDTLRDHPAAKGGRRRRKH